MDPATGASPGATRENDSTVPTADGVFDLVGRVENVRDGLQHGDLHEGAIGAVPAAVLVVGVVRDRQPGTVAVNGVVLLRHRRTVAGQPRRTEAGAIAAASTGPTAV